MRLKLRVQYSVKVHEGRDGSWERAQLGYFIISKTMDLKWIDHMGWKWTIFKKDIKLQSDLIYETRVCRPDKSGSGYLLCKGVFILRVSKEHIPTTVLQLFIWFRKLWFFHITFRKIPLYMKSGIPITMCQLQVHWNRTLDSKNKAKNQLVWSKRLHSLLRSFPTL